MLRLVKRVRSHNIRMNSFPLRQQNHYSITTEVGGMVRLAKRERSHNILMNSFPLRQQKHYSITTVSIIKFEETEKLTYLEEIVCVAATQPLLS